MYGIGLLSEALETSQPIFSKWFTTQTVPKVRDQKAGKTLPIIRRCEPRKSQRYPLNSRREGQLKAIMMVWLIGTDEAGYGPNLGPLVVAASLWRTGPLDFEAGLYRHLEHCVRQSRDSAGQPWKTPIADSKQLYQSRYSLAVLELGVLAALAAIGTRPHDWQGAWRHLAGSSRSQMQLLPWYRDYNCDLPLAADNDEVCRNGETLRDGLDQTDVQLVTVRAAALFPDSFNRQVAATGSKGTVLSQTTLRLVQGLLELSTGESVVVYCDKHGGRNRYAPLLEGFFPEHSVQIVEEGRLCSVYRWETDENAVEIRFVAKGDRFLPSALASMIAKYLRELSMAAFNEFWQARLPGLRPTAGYPADARRFKQAIASIQKELGIPDQILWRNR